jgi:dihydroorotate dehydrogenase electron transfer subunit
MMAAAVTLARRFECPSQVSLERIMGCGMGGCYSCVVPIRHGTDAFHHVRSCIAGPVMDGEQVLWDETRRRGAH